MEEEGWDAVATACGMGSAGISEETTTMGGAGGVLSAKWFTPEGGNLLSGVP